MSNCRKYGQKKPYIPNKRRDLRYIKTKTRNRERAMPNLVAVQEKEAAANGQRPEK
jgi:hypothetical protein